jgi:hypothetical protein
MGRCRCATLGEFAVVDMGQHEAVFHTLDRVRDRGAPYWWLYASVCRACKTTWVVAQEERQNDIFILKRIEPPATDELLRNNVWPPGFERYEALLEIGHKYGRKARFLDPPEDSSLPWTIADLARERPGIAVSDLARLLNLAPDVATKLARTVVANKAVDITFDA